MPNTATGSRGILTRFLVMADITSAHPVSYGTYGIIAENYRLCNRGTYYFANQFIYIGV